MISAAERLSAENLEARRRAEARAEGAQTLEEYQAAEKDRLSTLSLPAGRRFLATMTQEELTLCGMLAAQVTKELLDFQRSTFLPDHSPIFQSASLRAFQAACKNLPVTGTYNLRTAGAVQTFLPAAPTYARLSTEVRLQMAMFVRDAIGQAGRPISDALIKQLRARHEEMPNEPVSATNIAAGETAQAILLAVENKITEVAAEKLATSRKPALWFRNGVAALLREHRDEFFQAIRQAMLEGVSSPEVIREREKAGTELGKAIRYERAVADATYTAFLRLNLAELPGSIPWDPPPLLKGQITLIEFDRAGDLAREVAEDRRNKGLLYDREKVRAFQQAILNIRPVTGTYDAETAAAVQFFVPDALPSPTGFGTWHPPAFVEPTVTPAPSAVPPMARPERPVLEIPRLRVGVEGLFGGWLGKIAAGVGLFIINPFGGLANVILLEVVDSAAPDLLKMASYLPTIWREESRELLLQHMGAAARETLEAVERVMTHPAFEAIVIATAAALSSGALAGVLPAALGVTVSAEAIVFAGAAMRGAFLTGRFVINVLQECVLDHQRYLDLIELARIKSLPASQQIDDLKARVSELPGHVQRQYALFKNAVLECMRVSAFDALSLSTAAGLIDAVGTFSVNLITAAVTNPSGFYKVVEELVDAKLDQLANLGQLLQEAALNATAYLNNIERAFVDGLSDAQQYAAAYVTEKAHGAEQAARETAQNAKAKMCALAAQAGYSEEGCPATEIAI